VISLFCLIKIIFFFESLELILSTRFVKVELTLHLSVVGVQKPKVGFRTNSKILQIVLLFKILFCRPSYWFSSVWVGASRWKEILIS